MTMVVLIFVKINSSYVLPLQIYNFSSPEK